MRNFTTWSTSAVIAAILLTGGLAVPAAAAPDTPGFGPAIDNYASYVGQSTCDPTPKPGVVDFRDLLQQTYGRPDLGIARACDEGGQSEHKEGRALDYPFNAGDPAQRAQAEDLLNWLLATDQYGNPHAMARRLGLMYIIWNHQQWRAYSDPSTWRPYTGANPHTDHIHFSFSWAGARRETTWWTGRSGMGNLVGGEYNRDAYTDLLAVDGSGNLWLYPGVNGPGFGARTLVGTSWNTLNQLTGGEYNRDAYTDLLAADSATGKLWLYPGINGPGFGARLEVGSGGW